MAFSEKEEYYILCALRRIMAETVGIRSTGKNHWHDSDIFISNGLHRVVIEREKNIVAADAKGDA